MAGELMQITNNNNEGDSPTHAVNDTTTATAIAGMAGYAYKSNAGNVTLVQLTSDGKVPVSFDSPNTPISDSDSATPGALNTDVDVVTLTLTASTTYQVEFAAGSHFRACEMRIEHDNNGTPDVKHRWKVGSGDPNYSDTPACIQVTAGASGTQELKIIGKQLIGGLQSFDATLCIREV